MPQFLIDYYNFWLTFWVDHPVFFWTAVVLVVGLQTFAWMKR